MNVGFFFGRMVERSLQASQDGIQSAKTALINKRLTQEALAGALGVTRQPISKFFNEKPIDRELFVRICEYLGLEWQAIAGVLEKATSSTIADTVQAICKQIKPLVKERCGTMRVLDMTQPIELTGKQGIYTNVNILEKITARTRRGIRQLLQNADLEEFDRFGLSCVAQKRIPGIEAVDRHNKLMVLGKPGAGKTTFLKYLAMQCIEGNFLGDRVPLFITLKDFAETRNQPNFLKYIQENITNNATQSQLQDVIQQGKAFVLLDGLDEVREEDTGRVLREIRDFSDRYAENHFVITCRIAAKEYVFERFTEVEVADFDNEQISTFIHNWFHCKDPEKGEEFAKQIIEKLGENKPIKELASNPLLLTLLCLECEESLEFPKNRAELYERGLKVLLSKWDASRKIQRDQFYEKLSINRKEDLLSQLALKTFEQKDYFFKQRTVEHHIADYIINLPDARTDPKALQLDSEAALKSIEAQHGLLVERAKGIYSFSHLTFQEYFTAKQIVNEADYERLVAHLTEKRWREVFLLTANIMPKADRLLLVMKQAIDKILNDKKLQEVLNWVSERSSSVNVPYKLAAVRAFYFTFNLAHALDRALDRDLAHAAHALALARALAHDLAHALDHALDRDLAHAHAHALAHDLALAHALALARDLAHAHALALARDLARDLALVRIVALACNLSCAYDRDLARDYVLEFSRVSALFDHESQNKLQELMDQLPGISWSDRENLKKWWEGNGQSWTAKLRVTTIEHCNVNPDWQFTEEQKGLLQQYYDANKLLVDCLNSDCYVGRDVRQEIEETLLLPMAEIEKRTSD